MSRYRSILGEMPESEWCRQKLPADVHSMLRQVQFLKLPTRLSVINELRLIYAEDNRPVL